MRDSRRLRDRALYQLTKVRFLEFVREPEAMFWVFVFPILLTAGLGLAFRSRPPERATVGLLAGPLPAAVTTALRDDVRLDLRPVDDSTAMVELRTGGIAVLVVPTDTGVVYRYDDTRPDARIARQLVDDVIQSAAGRTAAMVVHDQRVHERGSRYIDFLLPGLLAMNLMGTGIWSIGFTIVDHRRRKLLKRLVATPMSRADYLMAFLLSRLGWLILEVGVLLAFGILVFGVPVRGSLGTVAFISMLGGFAFGAVGLLVAARARTTEAASGLMNFVMMPMWVFSGVFFSASNFPDVMQPFIQALPLTAVVDALRATMLEGAGLVTVAPELGIITAWMVAS
ncbi:MAG TPA: ABC transporter permease, partial [Longimicrobiales bacterium]|nr:ABC transporter permease [Longimicrobiales bacterium]